MTEVFFVNMRLKSSIRQITESSNQELLEKVDFQIWHEGRLCSSEKFFN